MNHCFIRDLSLYVILLQLLRFMSLSELGVELGSFKVVVRSHCLLSLPLLLAELHNSNHSGD